MLDGVEVGSLLRNLGLYTIGIAAAVAGALGLSAAIDLSAILSAALFVGGLVAVVAVHEFLGGPV